MVKSESIFANPKISLYLYLSLIAMFVIMIGLLFSGNGMLFDKVIGGLVLIFICLAFANYIVAFLLISARKMPIYWYIIVFLFAIIAIPILQVAIRDEMSREKPTRRHR